MKAENHYLNRTKHSYSKDNEINKIKQGKGDKKQSMATGI